MTEVIISPADAPAAIPIHTVREAGWEAFAAAQAPAVRAAAALAKFTARSGQLALVPNAEGGVERVLFGLADGAEAMALRALSAKVPPGDYVLAEVPGGMAVDQAALAWAIGAYRFDRYKQKRGDPAPRLVAPAGVDADEIRHVAHACALARDMVNTPANDMGPRQVASIAHEIAELYGASFGVIEGDALIEAGYPAVH
ncbi:MAG TPA: leucyl aminopeptidase family protein, partial [Caulobacteraceae bacterium]|nr:leucyl aminopeptidase family protein [Caulobacteraceae bacterium]